MPLVYCLVNKGTSPTDEIITLLYNTAQRIGAQNKRKLRLKSEPIKLNGEISTEYKAGAIGSISGVIFSATYDWEGGSAKMDFIVILDLEPCSGKWNYLPFFPIPETDPALN